MKKDPDVVCDIDCAVVEGGRGDDGGGGAPCVTVGEMFRNDLKPTFFRDKRGHTDEDEERSSSTFATTSPTSLKSEQRPRFDLARKSSIRRVPML